MIRTANVLLIAAAVVVMALAARTYWRDRGTAERAYTAAVNSRDIMDTSRNAVSALQDAESQVEGYVLTGEKSYSGAYAEDLQVWQDESGTLELDAVHDRTRSLANDLSKGGARVLDELATLVSLCNEGSTAAALDRLRQGSAIVSLEQTRVTAEKLRDLAGQTANGNERRIITIGPIRIRHLAEGAGALFAIALAQGLLLSLTTRGGNGPVSESGEKRHVAMGV